MRITICVLLSLIGLHVQAQFQFAEDHTVPVTIGTEELGRPWEGGMNSAQYQKMDLNADGTEDLVIYHRMSGEISTYLAVNDQFVYAPEYKAFFPEEVNDWLILADYNCDGLKDIFTSTPLGIKVFENTSTTTLSWTEAVPFLTFNDDINLQVNASDIPGIADIDGDGDLDIISYRFSTSNTIDYYKNQSIETTGNCGGLTFLRDTRRWGGLEECDCGSFAFGETCAGLGGTANPNNLVNAPDASEHAGGKTLLLIDIDNDGDMDLLTSDEFCETLYFMENKGTPELAEMDEFIDFPANAPASFYIFPSVFYEDLNFDGIKDLIISTNADNNIGNQIDFTATSRFASNEGTNTLPVFSNVYSPFLQQEMIDLGETTYPAFADVDGDADLDMVVGTRGMLRNGEFLGSLYLFENTGTRLRPAFSQTDTDYLELSSQRLRNIKPQFIDLDGDGDLDLAYQATEISGSRTALRYRINEGNFSFGDEREIALSVSENDQYHFAQIGGSGEPDLLIGSRLGSITLYLNEGQMTFGEGQNEFAGISSSFLTRSTSMAVADLNGDGERELVLTDITGEVKVLTGTLSANFNPTSTITNLVDNELLEGFRSTQLGEFSPIATADLFGDGKPALVLGNVRGGLYLYRNLSTIDGTPGSAPINLFAFPNPTNGRLFLQSSSDGILDIYTLTGQRIQQGLSVSSQSQLEIETAGMPAGLYLFRVNNGSQSGVIKVLIQP